MRFWSERVPFLREYARTHRTLHLGPGVEQRYGIGVDIDIGVRPDVVADLDGAGLPFAADSFDAVVAFSVVEHVQGFFRLMEEIHRVLKPGGFVAILTPHFSNDGSYIDPSHVLHLSARSFDYFIDGTPVCESYGFYTKARFRLRKRLLMLERPWSMVPGLTQLVNRGVTIYERHLCFLMRGQGIYLELEAVKAP